MPGFRNQEANQITACRKIERPVPSALGEVSSGYDVLTSTIILRGYIAAEMPVLLREQSDTFTKTEAYFSVWPLQVSSAHAGRHA